MNSNPFTHRILTLTLSVMVPFGWQLPDEGRLLAKQPSTPHVVRQSQPERIESVQDRIVALYRSGQGVRAMSLANGYLEAQPDAHAIRSALAFVLVNARRYDEFEVHRAILRRAVDAGQWPARKLQALDSLRAEAEEHTRLGERLAERLRAFDRDGAKAVIDGASAPPHVKELLQAQLEASSGAFDDAKRRLEALMHAEPERQDVYRRTLDELDARANEWKQLQTVLTVFGLTPINVTWNLDKLPPFLDTLELTGTSRTLAASLFVARMQDWSGPQRLKVWSDVANRMLHVAPLSEGTLTALFTTALAFEGYDGVKTLGDRILAGHGRVKIAVIGSTGLGTLVVDARKRMLSIDDVVALTPGVWGTPLKEHKTIQPFQRRFDEIREIAQSGKCGPAKVGVASCRDIVAVSVGAGTGSSRPFLHQELSTAFGEIAARQSLRNLGRYVAEVAGIPAARVKLVSEKGSRGPGLFATLVTGALAGMNAAGGRTELAGQLLQAYQGMAAEGKQKERMLAAEHATWEQFAADHIVDSWRVSAFDALASALLD